MKRTLLAKCAALPIARLATIGGVANGAHGKALISRGIVETKVSQKRFNEPVNIRRSRKMRPSRKIDDNTVT